MINSITNRRIYALVTALAITAGSLTVAGSSLGKEKVSAEEATGAVVQTVTGVTVNDNIITEAGVVKEIKDGAIIIEINGVDEIFRYVGDNKSSDIFGTVFEILVLFHAENSAVKVYFIVFKPVTYYAVEIINTCTGSDVKTFFHHAVYVSYHSALVANHYALPYVVEYLFKSGLIYIQKTESVSRQKYTDT